MDASVCKSRDREGVVLPSSVEVKVEEVHASDPAGSGHVPV